MIPSMSKNNDDHDVDFFPLVAVAVTAVDKGVICPRRCPLTSMLLGRRRGGDPSLSKLQSANNNEDNDALIASVSKNDEDHVRSLSGLRTMGELPAQPEVVACQDAAPWTRGQEAEAEAEAEATRGNMTTNRCK